LDGGDAEVFEAKDRGANDNKEHDPEKQKRPLVLERDRRDQEKGKGAKDSEKEGRRFKGETTFLQQAVQADKDRQRKYKELRVSRVIYPRGEQQGRNEKEQGERERLDPLLTKQIDGWVTHLFGFWNAKPLSAEKARLQWRLSCYRYNLIHLLSVHRR